MCCPDTERVESGGVGARALVMDIKAQKPTSASSKLTVSPSSFNPSARPPRPQHFIMVCTRKKDYGDPPLPKKRAVCDASAQVGAFADTQTKQRPCREFTLFPKLPCELRLMIWEASMKPRLIAVGPKGRGRPRSEHSKRILPALLSVNKDSRYCALRHYTLRFTITLTVDDTGRHRWDCPEFQCTKYHANVVMSSDDTLGLFGWETLNLGHGTRFKVENASGKAPWESYPTSHGAQPEVKKLAFLGRDIAMNNKIVDDLNSVVASDLDSILHTECTNVRKCGAPWRPWLTLPHAPYIKTHILVQSRRFDGSLEDWGKRLVYRARRGALPLWTGAPDILAFELGKKPKKIHRPATFVPAESMQDLLAVLPRDFVSKILDDFHASREWVWSQRHWDRRGF